MENVGKGHCFQILPGPKGTSSSRGLRGRNWGAMASLGEKARPKTEFIIIDIKLV